MFQYEIRYVHRDGSPILIWKSACLNDLDARTKAKEGAVSQASAIEIWRDDKCVGTFDANTGQAIARPPVVAA